MTGVTLARDRPLRRHPSSIHRCLLEPLVLTLAQWLPSARSGRPDWSLCTNNLEDWAYKKPPAARVFAAPSAKSSYQVDLWNPFYMDNMSRAQGYPVATSLSSRSSLSGTLCLKRGHTLYYPPFTRFSSKHHQHLSRLALVVVGCGQDDAYGNGSCAEST